MRTISFSSRRFTRSYDYSLGQNRSLRSRSKHRIELTAPRGGGVRPNPADHREV